MSGIQASTVCISNPPPPGEKIKDLPDDHFVTVKGKHCEAGPVEKAAQILNLNEGRNVTAETAFTFKFGQLERTPI